MMAADVIVSAMGNKHPGGRPVTKARTRRTYSVDKGVAEYIDSLPDGERSDFVSCALVEAVERHKKRQIHYIEVRLRKEQINLQDDICGRLEKSGKTWGFPTPKEPETSLISIPDDMDTEFLDELGVEYRHVKVVQTHH